MLWHDARISSDQMAPFVDSSTGKSCDAAVPPLPSSSAEESGGGGAGANSYAVPFEPHPHLSSSGGARATSRGPIGKRALKVGDRARQPLRLNLEHQHALPDGSPGSGPGCADPGPEDDGLQRGQSSISLISLKSRPYRQIGDSPRSATSHTTHSRHPGEGRDDRQAHAHEA